jgi:hypothetical protein
MKRERRDENHVNARANTYCLTFTSYLALQPFVSLGLLDNSLPTLRGHYPRFPNGMFFLQE